MGKAIMILNMNAAIASGGEAPLGGASFNTIEGNTQHDATEAATFSRLRTAISAGGSGTNTCRLRVNGANGNNVAAGAGTGGQEDTANTDAVSAGDDINLAFTDTGTDPTYSWARAIVEFSSGHGNFYLATSLATNGAIYDVESATRYLPIGGDLVDDGDTTEANVAWRNRAHTSWEALQVRVTANARTTDSTVRNRIAGVDGSAAITIGAGLTGLFTATGLGDVVADGDALAVSLTLGTGVEDLQISLVGATLKSSSGFKSEVFCGNAAGATRTASSTANYMTPGGRFVMTSTTESIRQVPLGFAATISNLRAYVVANTYTGNCTIKLMVNGVAQITLTITAGATGWQENASDTVKVFAEDLIDYEIDEGTANSITITFIGVTVDATPRVPAIMHDYRRRRAA